MGMRDYRMGFIGAPRAHRFADQGILHGWNRILTPGFKFFVHPEMSIYRVDDAFGRTLIVLGDVFVAHGERSLDDLLFCIASGDRSSLDDLTGRFALLVLTQQDGWIVHDPLGSQSIFRTLGPNPVISSHASLIARCDQLLESRRIRQYMASDEYRARVTRFLPGDLSIYENIVHLIPNNELDLRTGRTARYWPREEARSTTFEELLAVWDEYFRSYVRFIAARYDPVIGLTGGLDSRAVIATMRSMGLDARYITWDKMSEEEAARIPRLAAHLGGRHAWVRMGERPQSDDVDEIRQAARFAAGLTRGTPLLPAQIAQVIGAGNLFVKGLGGEVMRGPFNSRQKAHLPSDTHENLAYALYAGQVRRDAGKGYETTTREAIRGYLERANYGDDLHGLDPGDLIYWEQRMGTWTAVQHAEFSVVLNSHSAMNSRRMFATAWGLPDEDRFGPRLLQRIIEHYDPKLAAI
jgi:hypothetical protein